ncbi:MAG TPA: DNA polymerase III subunit delta [Methylomusa anaerophila]|uniref:DNA polymerase III subunit delta n=1 Tax=Methylomusa anaerophila TaxID=1930071 RepID=A0A348ANW8_9FIRM|nr:DNA polymerase III subunit delta [Methylomusa anaerophila]BBB92766.1 DNA polymerase III subunit delta [Methylomusa anaerophila]HML87383.1 DNA polymerase III subunit delta [Methylomusa anaerophila]
MDYKAALEKIRQGQVAPVYLIHGEETYLIRMLEQAILDSVLEPDTKDMNLTTFCGDPDLYEMINAIDMIPFMGGNNLIIIRETALFCSGRKTSKAETDPNVTGIGTEKADPSLENLIKTISNMPSSSYAVFIAGAKPDKRRKIYKSVEKYGAIVEAAPLRGKDLRFWLTERLRELNATMTPEAQAYLLDAVSMMPQVSLDFIDNELAKVILYTQDMPSVNLVSLREILSAVPEISVFAMLESLSQRQIQSALSLLGEQLNAGEHPIKLLGLLARQIRQLLQAKEMVNLGLSSRDIANSLKIPPFVGEKLMKQSKSFSINKLEHSLLQLAEADRDLKSSRTGPMILEKIIIELCQ